MNIKKAIAEFERAVAHYRKNSTYDVTIALVPDRGPDFQSISGVLELRNKLGTRLFHVFLWNSAYDRCCLNAYFRDEPEYQEPESPLLPTNPETLYNVLKASHAELSLLPQKEPQAIIVTGVNLETPLSSLHESLGSALSDLLVSRSLVWDRIVKGIGDNHWMMDGGGLDFSPGADR